MKAKTIISTLILIILNNTFCFAQLSEIEKVKNNFLSWTIDDNVDYSKPNVKTRYDRFISVGNTTKAALQAASPKYNFDSPGAIWSFNQNGDGQTAFRTVHTDLTFLCYLYILKGPSSSPNAQYHSIELKQLILKLFKYIKDKGVNSSTNFGAQPNPSQETVNINNSGASLTGFPYAACIVMMKTELKEAGEFAHHMGVLNKLTYFLAPDYPDFNFTYPGYNTDVIRATIPQRLMYILAQDDTDTDKVANMTYLKNFNDNALKIGYGWSDFIKPDFITYHHRGVYSNSYGVDALFSSAILNVFLNNTAYELDGTAKKNLKEALMAYKKFSVDFEIPRGTTGRFPTETASLTTLRAALAYLYYTDPVANLDAGQEFKRLWNLSPVLNTSLIRSLNINSTVTAMQIMDKTITNTTPAPSFENGQFSFPYAGLSIHKFNNNHISIKGTSKHLWNYENSASENRFGAYQSAGAIEIFTTGTPKDRVSNGLIENGWDWSHIPGTTVLNQSYTTLNGYTSNLLTEKDFLAHASLDDNGVFAMDYQDANAVSAMSAIKTNFFYKDKILCLGTNINNATGTIPVHTTLFQTSLASTTTETLINGSTKTGINDSFTQTAGAFWATDAVGNGFVLPSSIFNTSEVVIKRSTQTSRNNQNTADTQGNFVTAYINHGAAPIAGSYRYGIVLKGGSTETAEFANNFDNYFTVLQQDDKAHVVKFVSDNIYNYVIFNVGSTFSQDIVKKVDKPSIVMTQSIDNGNKQKISLTNPNLGLLNSGEFYPMEFSGCNTCIGRDPAKIYKIPVAEAVKVILAGKWSLILSNPDVIATINGNDTELTFKTINGITIQTELIKSELLGVDENEIIDANKRLLVYPNPTLGKVNLIIDDKEVTNLQIFDLQGNNLTNKANIVHGIKTISIDLSSFASGLYFIKANKKSYKVIKN